MQIIAGVIVVVIGAVALVAWWLRHEPGCPACRTSRQATPGGVCTVCGFDWDDHHKQVTTS